MKNNLACLGIDPGKTGAACLLVGGSVEFLDLSNPPAAVVDQLCRWALAHDLRAAVEKVGARPGQGVTSMFSFGQSCGWIHGVLDSLGISWALVRPQEWQKGVVTPKSGKDGALVAAQRLFPRAEFHGPKGGLKDGRVDAALIADWARRRWG